MNVNQVKELPRPSFSIISQRLMHQLHLRKRPPYIFGTISLLMKAKTLYLLIQFYLVSFKTSQSVLKAISILIALISSISSMIVRPKISIICYKMLLLPKVSLSWLVCLFFTVQKFLSVNVSLKDTRVCSRS